MKKRLLAFILLIAILASSLCACSHISKHTTERFDCFDTFSSLTVYCKKDEFEAYKNEFDTITEKYHKLFDIYNSYENVINIKILNESASLSPISVSKELFEALKYAKGLYNVTNGKFNIAIGALTSLWHDARTTATKNPEGAYIPTQEKINEALFHTDINSLVLDEQTHTVFYSDHRLSLELGAIAKGYVASVLYERFTELDADNFLINLGGNIVSHGIKPQNAHWAIKIENPFDDKTLGYNETVELKDTTVVTSGSYQRYFTYNEKQYSHIINSENGYPADIFVSVSVKAPADSSALADALSTALFCMSYEEGISLVSKLENVEVLWIFKDGSFKTTSGFGGAK